MAGSYSIHYLWLEPLWQPSASQAKVVFIQRRARVFNANAANINQIKSPLSGWNAKGSVLNFILITRLHIIELKAIQTARIMIN